jgi:hypothetical protein
MARAIRGIATDAQSPPSTMWAAELLTWTPAGAEWRPERIFWWEGGGEL